MSETSNFLAAFLRWKFPRSDTALGLKKIWPELDRTISLFSAKKKKKNTDKQTNEQENLWIRCKLYSLYSFIHRPTPTYQPCCAFRFRLLYGLMVALIALWPPCVLANRNPIATPRITTDLPATQLNFFVAGVESCTYTLANCLHVCENWATGYIATRCKWQMACS